VYAIRTHQIDACGRHQVVNGHIQRVAVLEGDDLALWQLAVRLLVNDQVEQLPAFVTRQIVVDCAC